MNFIVRVLKYLIAPISFRFKNLVLYLKYKKNSDSRVINWNWDIMNFNKIAILNLIARKFKDPIYLEIGCDKNETFNSIPILQKFGVDPKRGGNFRGTSDNFFMNNNTIFDIIFIDGDHSYEQSRKDLVNAFKHSKVGSWIVLHDLLPSNWIEQHVPRARTFTPWTGNVWKLSFELCFTKKIEFKIVGIDYGVGVIKIIESSPVLADLSNELSGKQFSWFYDNYSNLPIVSWEQAFDFIGND